MIRGKVKWFNNAKGYGFIQPDKAGEGELFAHYSSIEMEGYRTLRVGESVEFEVEEGPKGLHAIAIRTANVDDGEAQPDLEEGPREVDTAHNQPDTPSQD